MQRTWRLAVLAIIALLPHAGCTGTTFSEFRTAQGHTEADAKVTQSCLTAAETLERDGRTKEAIAKYEKVRQMDPTVVRASHHLAVLYDREGRDQEALTAYQRALQEKPSDSQILNDFGVFHYDRGHWAEAEALFRKAAQCDSHNQRAFVNLGRALGQQQRFQESYEAFASVLRPAEAHSNVGVLMAHQGQAELARQAFTQALALDPQLQQARASLTALNRAGGSGVAVVANQQ